MRAPWQLLAQADEKLRELDLRLIWLTLGGFFAVILVGAAIIAAVNRWLKRPFQEKVSASDQLAQFRSLYERGQLNAQEFERIRALLTVRMKQELDLPPAPSANEPLPAPPSPGPEEKGEGGKPPA
jgi:hypothetical protein